MACFFLIITLIACFGYVAVICRGMWLRGIANVLGVFISDFGVFILFCSDAVNGFEKSTCFLGCVVVGVMGMSHSLSHVVLRVPCSNNLSFLYAFNAYLSKMIIQSSSQICPNEMRLDCNFGKIAVVFDDVDNAGMGSVPLAVAVRVEVSGKITVGPS